MLINGSDFEEVEMRQGGDGTGQRIGWKGEEIKTNKGIELAAAMHNNVLPPFPASIPRHGSIYINLEQIQVDPASW